MDLSLLRFERDVRSMPVATQLDLILATAAGRQAATPTARIAARLAIGPSHRTRGAFERETARMLLGQQLE